MYRVVQKKSAGVRDIARAAEAKYDAGVTQNSRRCFGQACLTLLGTGMDDRVLVRRNGDWRMRDIFWFTFEL